MADSTPEEQQKATEALLVSQERLNKLQQTHEAFRKSNATETIRSLIGQKQAVEDLWKSGKVSFDQYNQAVYKANRSLGVAMKAAPLSAGAAWEEFKVKTGSAISELSQRMGLDLGAAGPVGIAMWIAGLMDAQHVITGWAGQTAKLFGSAGAAGAEDFKREFNSAQLGMLKSSKFVTDEMRLQFEKVGFALGLRIKEGGGDFKNTMEEYLMVTRAFGMSAEEAGSKMFNLVDTFKNMDTSSANEQIKSLGMSAVALGVAPKRLIDLNDQIISQFRLLNVGGNDVVDMFTKYKKVTGLGAQATEELTRSTFQAIRGLSDSKIMAMLAVISPKGAAGGIGNQFVNFARGGPGATLGGNRYQLVEGFFNKMSKTFPELKTNQFIGTAFLKSNLGVNEEVAVRLYDVLKSGQKGNKSQEDAVKLAEALLNDTTSYQEQAINTVVNMMNIIIRTLINMAQSLESLVGKGDNSGLLLSYQKMSDLKTLALNEKMAGHMESSAKLAEQARKAEAAYNEQFRKYGGAAEDVVNQNIKSAKGIERDAFYKAVAERNNKMDPRHQTTPEQVKTIMEVNLKLTGPGKEIVDIANQTTTHKTKHVGSGRR